MREKVFVITTMIMAVILIGAISSSGQHSENEQLRKYYQDYIAKCISKNQSKAGLLSPKSMNLRRCGALFQKKVFFLTNNKKMLVNEMIKKQVGTKPYKMEYYLNKRFRETYQ